MKALMLAVLLLFSAQLVFATSYTSRQSGDFNTAATWGGAGYPHSGDTWTISSGNSVTCSGVCASGLAAANSCTIDGTVRTGGVLTIAAGATLTHSGELDVQHAATLNVVANATSGNGTLVIAPGSGALCKLSFSNSGVGAPVFNLAGVQGSSGQNYYAVLNCNTALHHGLACMATPEVGGLNPTLNFSYFQVTNFGNYNHLAFSNFGVTGLIMQNGLFNNDGDVRLNLGTCGTCNFVVQNVSFTNPADTMMHEVFSFYGTAAQTGGIRLVQNVTASTHAQTLRYVANISVPGLQTGASILGGDPANINGFVGYNVALLQTTTNVKGQIFRGSAVIMDAGLQASVCYGFAYNGSLTFQDSFCMERIPNQHEIVSSVAGIGSRNLYQRYLCDGDGYFNFDTGDMIQDWGTYTLQNSIGLNFCGTMTTLSHSTPEVATVLENTNYNNFGETYCETACYDGISPVFRDNLLVKPADTNGRGIRGDDGVHGAAAFLRQTNFSMDYNGFYQMPGSGDPGAEQQPAVPALVPNPALGGIISYLNLPASVVGGLVNRLITTVSDPTHVGCSSCNFTQAGAAGVMPGDYFLDVTLRQYATVASVTDSTHLVLTSPGISGMRQGADGLTIYTSYWNHPGWYYGDSNNGSHDIHADPQFVDATRSLCKWYQTNSGAQVTCPTYGSVMTGVSLLRATTGTGGTTIVCATCNFTANGVTTADVVRVFQSTGQNIRGTAAITAVNQTSLTLATPITGLTGGDTFDFITATQGLGKMLVQAAGFDWNGNPVTPPSWATVANGMQYVYEGFAPRNFIYHGAGSPADGFPDIGAVPVVGGHRAH
jgi:hypothetical protein